MTSGAPPADGHAPQLVASVVPLVSAWRLDRAFDYLVPGPLEARVARGVLVRVPLGGRNVRGVVVALTDEPPDRQLESLRAVVVDEPLVPPPLDGLYEWLARRYCSPLGAALKRSVPPRVRAGRPPIEARPGGGPEPRRLRAYERGDDLYRMLRDGAAGTFVVQSLWGEDRGELIAELVAAAGDRAGATLVAVPEVRYGSEVLDALDRYWPGCARVDSARPDMERAAAWLSLARGHGLGGGGRAAVLAPAPNLGLIVVDEEHHPSYKEDRAPAFDARRVAIERARLQGAACVLVSPTPSLDLEGLPGLRRIGPSRARRRAARPVVEVVTADPGRAVGHELHERTTAALAHGERVALLAPRRGYARAVWCSACRVSLPCPSCEAGFSLERAPDRLRCGRCGRHDLLPPGCPRCGARAWRLLGTGSERLAEQVARSWPRAEVARLDPETLEAGAAHSSADLFVVTWMGTKPALRPSVTLVGVLDADRLIRRSEWRASELAYQALASLAEWAGPAASGGRLVIQASEPAHHAIQAVVRADHRYFVERELAQRAELRYPPYSELIKITAVGPRAEGLAADAASACRARGALTLGPISVAVGFELLVKCEDANPVADELRELRARTPSGSRLRVDVDPR
jgi:primosomal protein N'